MRKNINKLVAIAIGISVMSSSVVPVFAADTAQKSSAITTSTQTSQNKVLTLKAVVDAAINNSDKLQLKSKEIKMYVEKLKTQKKSDYISPNLIDEDFPYDKLDAQKDQTRQEKDFLQNEIENDITNKYNDIVASEIEVNKLKRQIEINSGDLKNDQLKQQLGLTTDTELKSSQIDIETLKNTEKVKEDLLAIKKEYLGVLTGLDINQYNLDYTINYQVFRVDGSIDNYANERIDEYLKYSDKLFDLSNDHLSDMEDDTNYDDFDPNDLSNDELHKQPNKTDSKYNSTVTDENGNTSNEFDKTAYDNDEKAYEIDKSKLDGYTSYLDLKYDIDSRRVSLDDTKKSLNNAIKQLYANLSNYENQISVLKQKIQISNKKLEFAKLQYDLGLTTKSEYDNTVLSNQDLDTQLRGFVNTYNTIKDQIQRPWILNSSSN